jgi:hypothetical protein
MIPVPDPDGGQHISWKMAAAIVAIIFGIHWMLVWLNKPKPPKE